MKYDVTLGICYPWYTWRKFTYDDIEAKTEKEAKEIAIERAENYLATNDDDYVNIFVYSIDESIKYNEEEEGLIKEEDPSVV